MLIIHTTESSRQAESVVDLQHLDTKKARPFERAPSMNTIQQKFLIRGRQVGDLI